MSSARERLELRNVLKLVRSHGMGTQPGRDALHAALKSRWYKEESFLYARYDEMAEKSLPVSQ